MMAAAPETRGTEEYSIGEKGLRSTLAALRASLAPKTSPGQGRALGLAPLDSHLPVAGLSLAAAHEVAPRDYRAVPAALGYLLALVKTVTGGRSGPIVWPLLAGGERHFGLPYAAGLKRFGFDPGRFVFARCGEAKDALWVMEEALRLGGVAAVIAERPPRMDLTASRRLQLAAEATATPIFLLRSHHDCGVSAARTSWRVAPLPASRDSFGLSADPRWRVALERAAGGRPGEWILEWNNGTRALCLSPAMADRTVLAGKTKKIA